MCDKVKYASEWAANFDLKKINKISNRSVIPIRAYFCNKCNSWHLTSKKDFLKEIELIADINCALKKENDALKEKNLCLEKRNHKEIFQEIKIDERVQQMQKGLNTMQSTILRLKNDNRELLTKVLQLQRKLEEGTS